MIALPIAGGFYKSDSLPVSAQECVNAYPNIVEADGLNRETVFGTPGLEQKVTTGALTTDANRGAHEVNGVPFFVNGGTLYEITSAFSATSRGSITGTGRVSMADNGIQLLIIVPGATSTGYIYNTSTSTLSTIASGFKANGEPQACAFVDGYFVCTTDSKNFIISNLNDGTTWTTTDVGTAEADPDATVAPIVFNNQLFITGSITIEAFQNLGGSDFPFQRTGLFIDKGVSAPFSLIKATNTFLWVGRGENEEPSIWRLEGNQPVRISTTAIDTILSDLTRDEVSNIFSWSYAQDGAFFVGFTLPQTTLVFDMKSERWHERKSKVALPSGAIETQRFRVNSVVRAYGLTLVGDSQDGRVGSMDKDVYDEYGERITRTISTQPFQNQMAGFTVPVIELTMESGVGNATETDPAVRMSRSLNGKTFTLPRSRTIGKVGEYDKRQIWHRNGRANRFEVFKFEHTGKNKFVIIQLSADIRPTRK